MGALMPVLVAADGISPPVTAIGSQRVIAPLTAPIPGALYSLMFITPIVGVVTFSWPRPYIRRRLFRLDFVVHPTGPVFRPTEDIHGYLAYALLRTCRYTCGARAVASFFPAQRVCGTHLA